MFNKEESNKKKKVGLGKINVKRIGNILLTMTLVTMLSTSVQAETTDCDHGEVEYRQRVYEYSQKKEYDENMVKIYNEYQLCIDGNIYPMDKYYITFVRENDNHNFHLMCVQSEYNDILTNSTDRYEYDSIARFRDTTAFINLLNSDGVIIDDKNGIITIIDKEKALEIVQNWDGMIHDKVSQTDAVENKDLIRRK